MHPLLKTRSLKTQKFETHSNQILFTKTDVELDDDDIFALAESYMAQLEHPNRVHNKIWWRIGIQTVPNDEENQFTGTV